jgi:UDP-2-acetamido-2,6-beta-L-arabino-hexul-4-ose reductase
MIHVGITGQTGFIGTHLRNFFTLKKEEVTLIPSEDSYFDEPAKLESFVSQCDVIIHLAALNRHNEPQIIYDTNLRLVRTLIAALETTGSKAHVLFSSSTQEERDNLFGLSKREGREMLSAWAERNNAVFTGMVIPNVFGPFGHPYYNSVVATFCHQVTHGEMPKIEVDATLKLIYVGELVDQIWGRIRQSSHPERSRGVERSLGTPLDFARGDRWVVEPTVEKSVSELLGLISGYKEEYLDKGIIPALKDDFERNLFNTFRSYMDIKNHYPVKLTLNTDDRGSFVETVKLGVGGQVSFSTTKPGVTRGNHFHTRKIERFAVIRGKARIELRRIGTTDVMAFDLDGREPAYVDMPVWYTHNITNTGEEELYTIFWINEFFNAEDADTYFEVV